MVLINFFVRSLMSTFLLLMPLPKWLSLRGIFCNPIIKIFSHIIERKEETFECFFASFRHFEAIDPL